MQAAVIVAILVAIFLGIVPGRVAHAGTIDKSGDINVSGLVSGAPPTDAPVITSPGDGATFTNKLIDIKGDCIVGLIVKIFSNDVFIGSAICQGDGHFALSADLFDERNNLIARQYDVANQASPDSTMVTVFYKPPNPTPLPSLPDQPTTPTNNGNGGTTPENPSQPPAVADFQLVINYDYTVQGLFQGKSFKLPICFSGGKAPYAISVSWGGGKADVFSRENDNCFTVEHSYDTAGLKTIIIRVSDANGNSAYLQFVVVVNGDTNAPVIKQLLGSAKLVEYWPSVVIPSVAAGVVGGIALNVLGVQVWQRFGLRRLLGRLFNNTPTNKQK